MTPEEKKKKLKDLDAKLEKDHGKGCIMSMDPNAPIEPIPVIPTGSLGLDIALGVGGLPRGRMVEIFGMESSGKTTLCTHICIEAQKLGGSIAIIDAEHAYDLFYARDLGLDISDTNFRLSQPSSGEEALDIAETLMESGLFDVIVIDSVAALIPKAELEADMDQATIGLQARMMSKACRKLTGKLNKSKCTLIFINQLREKIGGYGNPNTTTGGNSLKFYASIRIELNKPGQIKEGEEVTGTRIKAKVVKNKVAPPFKFAEYDLIFGKGISKSGEVLDRAVDLEIVNKSGAWYSYEGNKLGQGRENTKQFLEDNPELFERIENQVREKLKN